MVQFVMIQKRYFTETRDICMDIKIDQTLILTPACIQILPGNK